MGRKVKLHDTGLYGDSSVNFRAPNKKYYTTKDAYLKCEKNKKYRQMCIDKMYDLLGYKQGMIIPTYFYKKLKDYEPMGYECVYETMCSQEKSVSWAMKNKQFPNEIGRAMYVLAIIDNHVMDEYKKIVRNERLYKVDENSVVFNENVELDIENNTEKKKTDISQWLED